VHCDRSLAFDPQPKSVCTKGWILLIKGDIHRAHDWLSSAHNSPDLNAQLCSAVGLSYAAATLGDAELAKAWKRRAAELMVGEQIRLPDFQVVPLAIGIHERSQLDQAAIAGRLRV
jgi:hypothetical protein